MVIDVFSKDLHRGGYQVGKSRSQKGPPLANVSFILEAFADLKACLKKCCCFWFHSAVNIYLRFVYSYFGPFHSHRVIIYFRAKSESLVCNSLKISCSYLCLCVFSLCRTAQWIFMNLGMDQVLMVTYRIRIISCRSVIPSNFRPS